MSSFLPARGLERGRQAFVFVVFVRLTEFCDRQHAKAAARPRPRKQIAEAGEGGDILREIVLRDKIYSKYSTSLLSFEPAAFSEPWVSTY